MKIVLLSKEHFNEVVFKMNRANYTLGNLPTPTMIVPLADTVYMIGDVVKVTDCTVAEFNEFLNESPISLSALKRFIDSKEEASNG